MKKSILGYCGIKVVKITEFGPIKDTSQTQREKWLSKVKHLAANT